MGWVALEACSFSELCLIIIPAEYQPAGNQRGKVVRYKFAFQWCESQVSVANDYPRKGKAHVAQGEPWWLNSGNLGSTTVGFITQEITPCPRRGISPIS
jgi:hypothetical protein